MCGAIPVRERSSSMWGAGLVTDGLLRRVRPRLAVHPLPRRDLAAAYGICAQDPVRYVMPAMHLEQALASGRMKSGALWGVYRREGRGRELAGVVWTGANLIPAIPGADDVTLAEIGDVLARRASRPSALVGEAEVVRILWERTRGAWGPARSVRDPQPLLMLDGPPRDVPPADMVGISPEPVREAQFDDFDALLPACVAMFKGEVGYDPLLHGRQVYEERLRWLIRSGRSFVQYGDVGGRRQVVFKAEVGVVATGRGGGHGAAWATGAGVGAAVAELQGVWVHPDWRGRGVGRVGLARVVELVREKIASTVTLYVNDYNTPALRVYEVLGFRRVGTFVTVML